ncbi:MAG: sulfate adenylyltransferase subunit CysN [Myxococcales bacterium]|nr:sulfate adenylyltransferase subunit CysN [Myxococcales bacterium]MDD9965343.1 sulfate adenylyltransferase subunit CysN [Myxococcales bacterium]
MADKPEGTAQDRAVTDDQEEQAFVARDIEGYLAAHERKELLRFVAVGSVDDGKSTLIGRLLHDAHGVYEDQLAAAKKASKMEDDGSHLALITDGLKAEREQGITIDVAYRYFKTPTRKFIIADTPGHVQYTRNMVTGASTADVGIILIDARLGVLEQSRRHAYIASMLGIPHLLVAVNKMDLKDYAQDVFETIRLEFLEFAGQLRFKDITFVPISALKGDNVVNESDRTPWYDGETVLGYLEQVPIAGDRNLADFRYPVQYVLRPNLNYRGFSAQIASGVVRKGDPITVIPSGKTSRVKAIDSYDGEVEEAFAPMSVTLRTTDEVDCSRGDMLVHPDNRPQVARSFDADLVWMHERPLDPDKSYLIKHTTQMIRAQVDTIHAKVDLTTLQEHPADTLHLNDIAKVRLTCHRALYFDDYGRNRETGAFVLVDSLTNGTVAAGMIRSEKAAQSLDDVMREVRAGSAMQPKTQVSSRERRERLGQVGATVWLTGLPGSGRWALAYALERKLFDDGRTAHVVDPFREDLDSVISAARACTNAGLITICAFTSFKRSEREQVRERVGAERFFEVFVDTDPHVCLERRPQASLSGFEPPEASSVRVELNEMRLDPAVHAVVAALADAGQFET